MSAAQYYTSSAIPSASTAVTFRDILLDQPRGTLYLAGKNNTSDYYEKRWLNGSLIWAREFTVTIADSVIEAAIDFASGDLISTGHCHRSPPEGGVGESFFIRRLSSSSGITTYDNIYRVSSAYDSAQDYTSNILIDNARDRIYLGGEAGGALMVTAVQLSTGFLYRNETLLSPGFKEIGDLLFSANNSIIYLSAIASDNTFWTGQIDLASSRNFDIIGEYRSTTERFYAADSLTTRGKSTIAYPFIYHSFYTPSTCNSVIFAQNILTRDVLYFPPSASECLTSVAFHAPTNQLLAFGYSPINNKAIVKSWAADTQTVVLPLLVLPNLDSIRDAKFLGSSGSLYYVARNAFGNFSFPLSASVPSSSVTSLASSRSIRPRSSTLISQTSYSNEAPPSTRFDEIVSSNDIEFNALSSSDKSLTPSSSIIKVASAVHSSTKLSNDGSDPTFAQFLERTSKNPQIIAISASVIFIVLTFIFLIGYKCGDRFRFNEKNRRQSSAFTKMADAADTATAMN